MNRIQESDIIPPRVASKEELQLIHDIAYVEAVQQAGNGELPLDIAEGYGLGTEDTPMFKGMHEASALLVGGTLTAADWVMQEKAAHALHLGEAFIMVFAGKRQASASTMTVQ